MIQSLDVISINIWQILVSLINLVILFLLVKKFLYKPTKKMLEKRQSTIDGEYSAAQEARERALADKAAYEEKLEHAQQEADDVIKSAVDTANARQQEIIEEARERAHGIIRQAQSDAELEMKKAEHSIRHEIVDISTTLTEKLLGREINADDHRDLIDSFIEDMGDDDGTN
ncbi:MAG: F0F1 ATP synthase subunit B [Clostridia bacterium]|nr:F0F1 ATP synthase subunit B [Clostridia bacterium]